MKRIGNTWPHVLAEDNAIGAVIRGTQNKRGKRDVQKLLYDKDLVAEDSTLYHQIDPAKAKAYASDRIAELADGTWRHGEPRYKRQFCRNRARSKGKWRDLYIPNLDDHIVAHMLMQANMEAFTRGMHPHCCGSVPGRGIRHVVRTVKRWMKHDRQMRYFVKLDIRHFFDNINREKLKAALRRKIKDERSLWAFDQIIDSAPVACPVGYYTSPWFANLYLEPLDWYVEQQLYKLRRGKRIKYVRHYLRYVDDMLLFGTSRKDMEKAVRAIIDYLAENYGLEVKPTWEIKRIGQHEGRNGDRCMKQGTYWLDMVGYKFCRDATILRDGVFLSTTQLARAMYKRGFYTIHACLAINSKIGWASHCDSRHFLDKYIRPYVNITLSRRKIRDYVAEDRKQRSYMSACAGVLRG